MANRLSPYRLAGITALLALALTGLAGCELPPPYIVNPGEFDREHPDFGKQRADRDEVAICYNPRNTQAAAVKKMAAEECGKFRKTARYVGRGELDCPLLTPSAATFACESKGDYGPADWGTFYGYGRQTRP